jgi:hypothetical protein
LFWSLCYLVFRCVLQLVSLPPRSEDFKELEIEYSDTSSRCCADRRVDRN